MNVETRKRFPLLASTIHAILITSVISTSGCDSNNAKVENPVEPDSKLVSGAGVKGPLAFASVRAFRLDASQSDLKGTFVAEASTDAQAKLSNLSLPFPLTPPYLLEFHANSDTVDLTTGKPPVITYLRTVLTQSQLDSGRQIYATPLTTMAVEVAATQIVAGASDDQLESALSDAASKVTSTVGFGLGERVDIFNTPPLINDLADTEEEQADVAAYRSAVEALTAIVFEMDQAVDGGSVDEVLASLANDLADGAIDGQVNGQASPQLTEAARDILDKDPAMFVIPNTDIPVGDIEQLLADETDETGYSTNTSMLESGEVEVKVERAQLDPDLDDDGVNNASDAFPTDPGESEDTDGDGLGDNADPDDDNDGLADTKDAFPLDPTETTDTDGDGIGNNADPDDDNDGISDTNDDFPQDGTRTNATDQDNDGWPEGQDINDTDPAVPGTTFVDTDKDGFADEGGLNPDSDDDNDGVPDLQDAFPLDPSETTDTDGDGQGNNVDTDDDNDGTPDSSDLFPLDDTEDRDFDGDGIGDRADTDDDGDGLSDADEAILRTDPFDWDTDGDGFLDGADDFPLLPSDHKDSDNDGVGDSMDTFPDDPNEWIDLDGDGIGDEADLDDDNDGLPDAKEIELGTNQRVADSDEDGVNDGADALPLDKTETLDTDKDGIGNNADTDDDGDGVSDADEATAGTNPLLVDSDGDGVNDDADLFPLDATETTDTDGDGIGDVSDNCIDDKNPDQLDTNGDGIGDACAGGTAPTPEPAVWDQFNWDDGSTWQ